MIPKTYQSPRWSGEILDCALPMTFDQYSQCSYNCLYCFGIFQRACKRYNPLSNRNLKQTDHFYKSLSSVDEKEVIEIFHGERKSQFTKYINEKYTLQWGGMSDPFDMFEKKYGIGLKILRELYEMKYPICFSTKGTWWVDNEEYASLFENNNFWNVKFSIINLNEERANQLEGGVVSPMRRIEAIRLLKKIQGSRGAGITLRLRPFIIGYSDVNDEYLDLIRLAKRAGADAVSTEFFCLEGRMTEETEKRYAKISNIIGFDIVDFYYKNSNHSGYMRLNWKIKKPYIEKMENLCRKLGIRFYVSDAHHKDKCQGSCCCGLNEDWKYNQGQFTEALHIAKIDGEVYFNNISQKFPESWHEIKIVTATCMNIARGTPELRARFKDFTIADYVRYIWNNPNNEKSPYKYFCGLLYPIGLDDNNDVIYKYNSYKE